MTKKRVTTTLFIALVVLTLISCCFLGSTFARYVSGGNGSASVDVAKWEITGANGTDSIEIDWDQKLSPAMAKYNGSSDAAPTDRVALLAEKDVATLANNGDVDATITITISGIEIKKGMASSYGTGLAVDANGWLTMAPTEAEVEQLFVMSLSVQKNSESAVTVNADATNGGTYSITLAPGESLTIKMNLSWKSADNYYYTQSNSDHAAAEDLSDALDTWAGENVTSLGWTLSYIAEQASELPSNS